MYGIRPSKGPTSGGTLVKLYGQDLKYKKFTVSVHGRLCELKEFDANTITCITGYPSSTMNPKDTIAMHIDRILYVLDKHPPPEFNTSGLSQTFEYTPDPYITNIRPGFTTVSGSMNLTAFGQHFDSVQFPKLVMKVDENQIVGKTEFIEDCWTDPQANGTLLTCRTPSLKERLVYPTRTQPLLAQVSFLMDGVQGLKDFPKHHRDLSRLLYYPDPEFTIFHETEKVKKDQKVLQIRGDNLDLVHATEKLKVKIGRNESCEITRVSSDTLFCNLAPGLFSSNSLMNETNLSVEVLSGSTTHQLGYIELVQKDPQAVHQENSQDEGTRLWVILMVAVLVVICMCVVFVGYNYCWRRGKKPLSINDVALSNRDAVNHDYRPVPTRAIAPLDVQDEQNLIGGPFNQTPVVSMVPIAARLAVPANAGPALSVNAGPALSVNAGPAVPGDRASAAVRSMIAEISSVVDKETLFLFASRKLIISNRYLTIFSEIGSGQFGCVYAGLLRQPNEVEQTRVAVKTLREGEHSWLDPKKVKLFLDEAVIMLDFKHPNVLGLYGVCFDATIRQNDHNTSKGMPSIVLPFMDNGDLHGYISYEFRCLIVSELVKFAVDVAAGMAYLEDNRCLHRDLAARNVVLDLHKNAKVNDFGLSRDIYIDNFYDQSENSTTKIPTKWTAPEALQRRIYSSKSDVWSYGVLLWELMTRGFPPYYEVPNREMLDHLLSGKRLPQPEKCPLNLYKVMLACWNFDSSIRPGFHELHECMGYMHAGLLRNSSTRPEPDYVPAEHSIYHDSRELYLSMEGKPLQRDLYLPHNE